MSGFAGVWKLESSENFDAYLKTVGVSWPMRQMANAAKPTLTVTVNGDHYIFKQESAITTTITEFDIDKEFDEKLADGRVCKSIVKKDGEKLVQDQKGKYDSIFERWVEGDVLTVTCECNGVKATRKYKRTA